MAVLVPQVAFIEVTLKTSRCTGEETRGVGGREGGAETGMEGDSQAHRSSSVFL